METTKKQPLIVVAGPTAVGKSELAAEIARRIHGEIISADSMQVYRHMDIGTAKVTLEEMMGVPHHMIDVVDPQESMDVSTYAEMANAALNGIISRGNVPILCGGTGFYIQAVTNQIDFTETSADEAYRSELQTYADEHGNDALHARLAEVDPDSAKTIHPNNVKRVIRALEFLRQTGEPISRHNEEEKQKESPFNLVYFFLDDDRAVLYDRIDRRVDFMMEEGLQDEVAFLMAMGLTADNLSMQGIGYKEILRAMNGDYSMEEAIRLVKQESRHYAKRQVTWFKRIPDVIHILRGDYKGDNDAILDAMLTIIEERTGIKRETVGDPLT